MKAYRKPSGVYIELDDRTPVSSTLVQVAPRPSVMHVFASNWNTAPMDPAICWVMDVVAAKKLMWLKIKAEREKRKYTGGVKVGTLWFDSDANSRSQYNTMLSMAVEQALPTTYAFRPAWKTMSGATTPMTVSLVRQIRDAALINEAAIFDNAESHKTAMEASATPLSYSFASGWPPTFA